MPMMDEVYAEARRLAHNPRTKKALLREMVCDLVNLLEETMRVNDRLEQDLERWRGGGPPDPRDPMVR